jgi:hypothetical protein
MRVLRGFDTGLIVAPAAERVDVRRRQETAEVTVVARCPRCGGELVPRIARGRPGFWCRCPVRRGLVA